MVRGREEVTAVVTSWREGPDELRCSCSNNINIILFVYIMRDGATGYLIPSHPRISAPLPAPRPHQTHSTVGSRHNT